MTGRPLRVLVVDDNESVRRTMCQLLQSEADIEVGFEAVDGQMQSAGRRARRGTPRCDYANHERPRSGQRSQAGIPLNAHCHR